MIYKNVELFNAAEIEQREDGAILMRKFPRNVYQSIGINFENKHVARMTTGCEIRFVGNCAVTLSAWDEDGVVELYKGDFIKQTYTLKKGVQTTIFVNDAISLDNHDLSRHKKRFSPDVWRIVFAHDFCGILHSIDEITPIRPPRKDEVPRVTALAYGSSITHGANSQVFSNAYISVMAYELGIDMLNKGMGGSCMCDKVVADYIEREEWDFVLLELGVNMINIFTPEEFGQRADYLLGQCLSTDKKVVLISPFRHFRDLPDENKKQFELNMEFRKVAEELRDKYACDILIYLDGLEIVDDYKYLTCDLIHPSVYGHRIMGTKIAELIKDRL